MLLANRAPQLAPRPAADPSRTVIIGLRSADLPAADRHVCPALAGDVDPVEALSAKLTVHFTIDARQIGAEGD